MINRQSSEVWIQNDRLCVVVVRDLVALRLVSVRSCTRTTDCTESEVCVVKTCCGEKGVCLTAVEKGCI